jgi:fatty-acyl-CoA synthase
MSDNRVFEAVAPDWVWYHSRRNPSALALENVDTGQRCTWRELEQRVAAVAGMLQGQFAVQRGDRIALLAESDARIFELQFACIRLGALLVPLNWRLTPHELETLLRDAQPSLLVHDESWAQTAAQIATVVGLGRTLAWGESCSGTGTHHPCEFDRRVAQATPMDGDAGVELDAPTHILYTSGTTGLPKGALTTNRTLLAQAQNTTLEYALGFEGAKYLGLMPLFHAGGLTSLAGPVFAAGGAVAFGKRFDPERACAWLADPARGVTHVNGTPVFFEQMAKVPGFAQADFSHIRHAHNAGAPIAEATIRLWARQGLKVQAFFGGTEMGPTVMALPAHRVLDKPTSSGMALPLTRVRLVGDDGQEVVGPGEGEIWLSGPSISPGYWRRDREGSGFVGEWLRTGDVARRDEEGYYTIVDRIKDMFKSGGESVFPAEVERELSELPGLAEVAVIGVPDERWGEIGCAFVVAGPGPEVTLAAVQLHLAGRLAKYKIPKVVRIIEALPRNALGKVDKKVLRKRI